VMEVLVQASAQHETTQMVRSARWWPAGLRQPKKCTVGHRAVPGPSFQPPAVCMPVRQDEDMALPCDLLLYRALGDSQYIDGQNQEVASPTYVDASLLQEDLDVKEFSTVSACGMLAGQTTEYGNQSVSCTADTAMETVGERAAAMCCNPDVGVAAPVVGTGSILLEGVEVAQAEERFIKSVDKPGIYTPFSLCNFDVGAVVPVLGIGSVVQEGVEVAQVEERLINNVDRPGPFSLNL